MELKKIVTISGKGGLFQIIKPAKNAIIVEAIDELKTRFTISASARVSVLKEVSIYTHNADGATPLLGVLQIVQEKHPEGIAIDTKKVTDAELKAFMEDVLPDYNAAKVYASDIKKMITWFNLLLKYAPEVFLEVESQQKEVSNETPEAEEVKA